MDLYCSLNVTIKKDCSMLLMKNWFSTYIKTKRMTISPNVVILIRRVCMNDGVDDILDITCIESNTSKHLCKIFSSSVFDMICWAIDLTVENFSVKLQCTKSHHILSQYYFSTSQHHWHGIFNVALLWWKLWTLKILSLRHENVYCLW